MTRPRRPWGLLAVPLLLAGCGATSASTPPAAQPEAAMSMAPGHTMPRAEAASTARSSGGPPESALMVCGHDITAKVEQVLKLAAPPHTVDTWADSVYTCTYSLPMGPMVLTVRVAPDKAAAGHEFDALPATLPQSRPLIGLGERSQGTPDGTVEVLKDNQILTVDASKLPETFGVDGHKRADFAYEVASNVLGCWTGDGDE